MTGLALNCSKDRIFFTGKTGSMPVLLFIAFTVQLFPILFNIHFMLQLVGSKLLFSVLLQIAFF